MKIKEVTTLLESWAPMRYAESYDNVGLLTGHPDQEVSGVLIAIDSTEEIVEEAIRLGHNLIIAHHPILFKGIKRLNGNNYVERAIIRAIKHDIALYAIHTNLDNVNSGVNHQIANLLGLQNQTILLPKTGFTDPPIGSGMVGILPQTMDEVDFLIFLKATMQLPLIKHTVLLNKPISKVAVCGGSGSFLIPAAMDAGAQVFITSDLKYHEYFDADRTIILMDIGHFESERFTIGLIHQYILSGCPGLAIVPTTLNTNPVQYFL